MLPGMELMGCQNLAVPADVMHHVVRVESSYNPYAIGVVGGRLVRQPKNLPEAVSTARMLEERGYNFSLGLAQVNRYNLDKYGLDSYEKAFDVCPNLSAGARILAECHSRSGGDWGKSFSCYYSGNFVTGFRHGYVQKVYASMGAGTRTPSAVGDATPIDVLPRSSRRVTGVSRRDGAATVAQVEARLAGASAPLLAPPEQQTQASTRAYTPQAVATSPVHAGIATASLGQQPVQAQAVEPVAAQQPAAPEADAAFVF